MSNKVLDEIFSSFQKYMVEEQDTRDEIRNVVKVIENTAREIATILQVIHTQATSEDIHKACLETRKLLDEIRVSYEKLSDIIPKGQYYRYNDHWRFVTQRLCFFATLVVFLENGVLVSRDTTADMLGLKSKSEESFHLDVEDYLMGVLQLCSELARFAVNAVTNGDFERPLQISSFVAEVNAGFRLLNLKNDSLRKRFDALKYDVKKIEEVVYDLSIRGLKPGQSSTQ